MEYLKHIKKYGIYALLALTIAVSVPYIIILNSNLKSVQSRLDSTFEKSFRALYLSIDGIDSNLDKLTAVSSPASQTEILAEIRKQTGELESYAAVLPVSYQNIHSFTESLNILVNTSKKISSDIANGDTVTTDNIENLKELAASLREDGDKLKPGSDNKDDFNSEVTDIQALNYMNASIRSQQTAAITYEITPRQAEEILNKSIGINKISDISRKDDVLGEPECYSFEGSSTYGEFYAMVTKSDGKIRYFYINTKNMTSAIPSYDRYQQLANNAEDFLLRNFDMQFSSALAVFYGGCAIIDLIPIQSDIAMYTDIIKVWVDISKNEIVGLDSHNFLANNRNRYIPKPNITQDLAQEKLSPDFSVKSCRLVLISTETEPEILCYEFSGGVSGNQFLVYINAANGREEKILKLNLTEDGIAVGHF